MNEKQEEYTQTWHYDPALPYREQLVVGFPRPTYHPGQVGLTDTAQEQIRQIVREEIQPLIEGVRELLFRVTATFTTSYNQPLPDQALDHLMEAVQGEPDPDIEMAAVLATLSEDEWNALVERVKEMKRE